MSVLDGHVLAIVQVNPEARVSVTRGASPADLVQAGTRLFLVKVINQAGVTAPLRVTSPQAARVSIPSWSSDLSAKPPHTITSHDIEERWADISFFDKPPLAAALSGVPVEYRILEVYSRDAGQRAAEVKFDVGQGTADLAFRSDIPVVFTAAPARRIGVRVEDERGRPSIARLIVRDGANRVYPAMSKRLAPDSAVSGAGVSRRRRGTGAARRQVHRRVVRRPGLSDWHARDHHRPGTARRVCHPARALDRSRRAPLVLRRSPRARRRLLALRGSHARCRPRRHRPPGTRRALEHRQHPHVGPLLLPPEAVLLRQRRRAIDGGHEAAVRPGGLGLPVEPRRASRAARAEGAGLSRHEAHRGLADVDEPDPAVGAPPGRGHRLRALGLGPADRGSQASPSDEVPGFRRHRRQRVHRRR